MLGVPQGKPISSYLFCLVLWRFGPRSRRQPRECHLVILPRSSLLRLVPYEEGWHSLSFLFQVLSRFVMSCLALCGLYLGVVETWQSTFIKHLCVDPAESGYVRADILLCCCTSFWRVPTEPEYGGPRKDYTIREHLRVDPTVSEYDRRCRLFLIMSLGGRVDRPVDR